MDFSKVNWVALFLIALVPMLLLIGTGTRLLYRRWRIARSSIAYRMTAWEPSPPRSPTPPTIYGARLIAEQTAERILGASSSKFRWGEGFNITGGATGHIYRITARAAFPIRNLDTHELLCARPFNAYSLPTADIMLTQALYLQCPQTERAFLALCNVAKFYEES